MASGTQSELAVGGLAWLTTGRGVNGEYALVLIASAKHASSDQSVSQYPRIGE